jgi:16S rRNA (uracil1498-N3)-methyltransferase
VSSPVFAVPTATLHGVDAGSVVTLEGAEGRHAATVRRLRVGEPVVVTDGLGVSAHCLVDSAERDRLTLRVLTCWSEPPPSPRLVVVQALAKGDRGELAVETMTEVGVDVIVPWAAARSITQWRGDRGSKALRRWRGTAHEAGKQARRSRFPEVAELASTAEVAELLSAAALGLVLHEGAHSPLAAMTPPAAGDVVLVVGPEGGLTTDELDAFAVAGASAYLLGPSVLRTSTAGAVAAALLLSRTARWAALPTR